MNDEIVTFLEEYAESDKDIKMFEFGKLETMAKELVILDNAIDNDDLSQICFSSNKILAMLLWHVLRSCGPGCITVCDAMTNPVFGEDDK